MNALVVGGNSGVGLSVVLELLERNYDRVYIVGKDDPDYSALSPSQIEELKKRTICKKVNFVTQDYTIFEEINDIDTLVISVGFGRAALFEDLTEPEVNNLLLVNLNSVVNIIKHYYLRIKSTENFYTAVMVSICGRLVSPFFSVYGAAKGGLRFFIENLNCELSKCSSPNRITEVSPGSLKGTNFNGQGNQLSLVKDIAQEIVDSMLHRKTLYIPSYDNVYSDVLQRYYRDPIVFGSESYEYKLKSGRISNKPQVIIGYLSGTFDLFHIGHLNLLRRAKEMCDFLIVSVHDSGAWKGKETFIPYEERKAIVESIKYVDLVVEDYIEDADAWDQYHYNRLFVGSDYKGTDRFKRYETLLKDKAEIIYFPYTQGTSSTQLRNALKIIKRP